MQERNDSYQENVQMLRKNGFSEMEAMRLSIFAEHLQENREYIEMSVDRNRLEFARWLVANGRISEDGVTHLAEISSKRSEADHSVPIVIFRRPQSPR